MSDINIGEKIAEFRKAKNLSIRELATLSQVTPSLLSQIERGLSNPSINSLKLISKALDIPIFHFFLEPINTKNLIVRADKRKRLIFPESKNFSYELLSPNLNGDIEFVLMKLTPGSCSSNEPMCHDGEEVAIVIEGSVTLFLSDDKYVLNKGDSVRISPKLNHKWQNTFDKSTSVIFAVTPPSF